MIRAHRLIRASWLNLIGGYSKTNLGVMWLPISVTSIVFVIVLVFHRNDEHIQGYFLYVASGYWVWQWASMILGEGADQFRTRRQDLDRPSWSVYDFLLWCTIDRLLRHFIATIFLQLALIWFIGLEVVIVAALFYVALFFVDMLISSIFSAVTLFLFDFKFLLGQVSRMLFFVTPIFWGYGSEFANGSWRRTLIDLNPIAMIMSFVRSYVGAYSHPISFHALMVVLLSLVLTVGILRFFIPRDWRNIQ